MSRILIVEDEHALGNAMALAIQRMGHEPVLVGTGGKAKQQLSTAHLDAVVLDIGLPDTNGVEVLKWIRESGSDVPVLIVTAHTTLDNAIAAQKLGVADYLIKPLDLMKLEQTVAAMVSKGHLAQDSAGFSNVPMIGASPCMHSVLLGVARACAGNIPVMITGPVGSGKSLAARVIHTGRGNRIDSLRTTECGRFENENELRRALGDTQGTIVFDNLTDLRGDLQLLLSQMITGADREIPAVMGTMRQNAKEAVSSGRLREDLYYGFSSMVISIPPLSERAGDIPALSRFFTAMTNGSGAGQKISAQALEALQAYQWPGNIRELRHVFEHACAMSRGQTILPGHLPPHVSSCLSDSGGVGLFRELDLAMKQWLEVYFEMTPADEWKYDDLVANIEASLIRHLLAKFEDRPTHLAAAMGMNRATLRQKIRRLLE